MATTRIRRAGANPPNPEQEYDQAARTAGGGLPDEAFLPDDDLPIEDLLEDSGEYQPLFDEDFSPEEDFDPLDEELLTEEEQAELRRSRWQLLAGLWDFAGVILGTAAILTAVTLLVSLINWLMNDLSQSFILLQKNF